jgi:hypothetical protein
MDVYLSGISSDRHVRLASPVMLGGPHDAILRASALEGESEVLAFFEQNEALESNGSLVVAQRVKQAARAQSADGGQKASSVLARLDRSDEGARGRDGVERSSVR